MPVSQDVNRKIKSALHLPSPRFSPSLVISGKCFAVKVYIKLKGENNTGDQADVETIIVTKMKIDIPGYAGRALRIERHSIFRVIDVEGCQIADLFILSNDNPGEFFSPALTRQVIFRLVPKPGDFLYSNHHRPMLAFLDDTSPGRHDMAFAPCDPGFYVDLGADPSHPNCRDNFYQATSELNLRMEPPPDPFNLFQNTAPKADGDFVVGQTPSKAGDYVEFKAEMDVIVVVTACSVDLPTAGIEPIGGKSTPLRIQVA